MVKALLPEQGKDPGSPRRRRTLAARLRPWIVRASFLGLIGWLMTNHTLERMFVYFPYREIEAEPTRVGMAFTDVWTKTSDGVRIHGWFVPRDGAVRTLLILHGNAGNISHRVEWLQMLHSLDVNLFIIDYRGYGRSEGSPFEEGLYRDAQAAWEWWAARGGANQQIVLFGESLGGAVAVHLAARQPCAGVILQSTFSSGEDMARRMFPLGLLRPLVGVHFDSMSEINAVRCPKLFIHGDRDSIVPFELGHRLFEAAPEPKEFFEVGGAGHNDLPWVGGARYVDRIARFLAGLPAAAGEKPTPVNQRQSGS